MLGIINEFSGKINSCVNVHVASPEKKENLSLRGSVRFLHPAPEEIAEAAYYLATADFVTGETLNVAGGQTAGHSIAE